MRTTDLSHFLDALRSGRMSRRVRTFGRSRKTTCDQCGRTGLKKTWAVERRDGSVAHLGSECAKKAKEHHNKNNEAIDRGPLRLNGLKLTPAKIVLKIDNTKSKLPYPDQGEKSWGIFWLVVHPTGEIAYNPEDFSNYVFKEVSSKDAQHPVMRRIRSEIIDRLDKTDPNYKILVKAIGRDGAAFAVLPHKERGRYFGSSERLTSELTDEFVRGISEGEHEYVTSLGRKQIRVRTSSLRSGSSPDRAFWAPNWISFSLKETHLVELPPVTYSEAIVLASKMVDQLRAMGMYSKLDIPAYRQKALISDERIERRGFWNQKLEAGFLPDRPVNPLLVAWTDPKLARKALTFWNQKLEAGFLPDRPVNPLLVAWTGPKLARKALTKWEDPAPIYARPFVIGGVPIEGWADLASIPGFHVIPGGEANVGFLVVGPLKPGWTWKDYVTQGLWLTEPETYDKQKSRPLLVADVKELGYTPDPSDLDKGTSSLVKLKDEKGKLKTYEVVLPDDVWGTYKSKSRTGNRAISKRLQERLGLCYSLAAKYVTKDQSGDSELVHGSIQAYGNPRIDHAWVEEGAAVYDPVLDKWMRRHDYYKLLSVREAHRYTQDQVFKNLLTHHHWGPWESETTTKSKPTAKSKKRSRKR